MEGLAASNHAMDAVEEKRKSENKDNINAKLTDLSNGKVFSTVISENFCEF